MHACDNRRLVPFVGGSAPTIFRPSKCCFLVPLRSLALSFGPLSLTLPPTLSCFLSLSLPLSLQRFGSPGQAHWMLATASASGKHSTRKWVGSAGSPRRSARKQTGASSSPSSPRPPPPSAVGPTKCWETFPNDAFEMGKSQVPSQVLYPHTDPLKQLSISCPSRGARRRCNL